MLHLSTVESTTLELLKKLQQLPVLCNTRLVGGTALALQLGHRKSVDLDFFGQINVDSQDLKEALRTLGTLTILNDSKNIHIYVLNEVKIDIVNYTYPWLDDVVHNEKDLSFTIVCFYCICDWIQFFMQQDYSHSTLFVNGCALGFSAFMQDAPFLLHTFPLKSEKQSKTGACPSPGARPRC